MCFPFVFKMFLCLWFSVVWKLLCQGCVWVCVNVSFHCFSLNFFDLWLVWWFWMVHYFFHSCFCLFLSLLSFCICYTIWYCPTTLGCSVFFLLFLFIHFFFLCMPVCDISTDLYWSPLILFSAVLSLMMSPLKEFVILLLYFVSSISIWFFIIISISLLKVSIWPYVWSYCLPFPLEIHQHIKHSSSLGFSLILSLIILRSVSSLNLVTMITLSFFLGLFLPFWYAS